MFTHGGEEAEEAIRSFERRFRLEIVVDWNQNGRYDHPLSDLSSYVSNAVVDRSLRGSAPEELMLIEGASAAELTFTAYGEYEGLPFSAVFSPYNGLSPMYLKNVIGAEVKYRIGVETVLGVVWYPQFTGNIRTITPNRGDSTVEFTALDRVEKLRKPVRFPVYAMSDEHVSYGETDSQLVRSHWVIDHCLRQCDVSPTPLRPTYRSETGLPPDSTEGPQFFVSGNGAYLPTLGWLDNMNADSFPNPGKAMYAQNGPKHPAAPGDAPTPLSLNGLGLPIGHAYGDPSQQGIIRYWVVDRESQGTTHYLGCTINTQDGAYKTIESHNVLEVRTGDLFELWIQVETGKMRGVVWNAHTMAVMFASTWVTIPDGQSHVDLFVQWDNSDTTGGRIYAMAGANNNGGFIKYGDRVTNGIYDDIQGRVTIGQALSLSDVFYASRNYYGSGPNRDEAVRSAKYAAALDVGLNRFSHLPVRQDDAWNIITEVAAAEFGSVFWDEEGRFRFWNYDTMLAKQANPVRTVTLDDVSGLQITNTFDSVRNVYTAQATRKRSQGIVRIYESHDEWEFHVPAFSWKRFRLWIDDVVSPLTFKVQRYVNDPAFGPVWSDAVDHGYALQFFWEGTWQAIDDIPGIEINAYYTAQGYLVVTVLNNYGAPIRLTTNDGRPAFRLSGTKVFDYGTVPITVQDSASIDRYGARNYELSGDWYQDSITEGTLLSKLLTRTSKPIPTTDAITMAGDPRLQLGDTVELRDEEGFGEQMKLQIYGIRREFDVDSGLTDTLTVEMIEPAGVGLWDSRQYGLWDKTFTWS